MNIKKLNEELDKILKETETDIEDSPILTPNDPDFDFYWNMVKEFDEYVSKNESLNEEILNEVLKNECGFELQSASISLIPNKEKYNLPSYLNSFSLKEKIQWLIDYLNIVTDKKDLIGFKLTNVGTINYKLKNKFYSNKFIILVGICKTNSTQLTDTENQSQGLHHMKYGVNKHWNESCEALLAIPTEFANSVKVIQSKDPEKFYNYVFYSPNGYTYAFGVPKDKHAETILISCY